MRAAPSAQLRRSAECVYYTRRAGPWRNTVQLGNLPRIFILCPTGRGVHPAALRLATAPRPIVVGLRIWLNLVCLLMLNTARLLLRPWQTDDHQAFFAIVQDPDVMRYIGPGHTWNAEMTAEFISRQIQNQQALGYCLWAVVSSQGGALLGFCGGKPFSAEEIEIGWRLRKDCWGQGRATEAAQAAVAHLQTLPGVRRLFAHAREDNHASIRVMQKLGMTFHHRFDRQGAGVVHYVLELASAEPT